MLLLLWATSSVKNHNGHPKVAQLLIIGQSGHPVWGPSAVKLDKGSILYVYPWHVKFKSSFYLLKTLFTHKIKTTRQCDYNKHSHVFKN
jgi:hypothetical protein